MVLGADDAVAVTASAAATRAETRPSLSAMRAILFATHGKTPAQRAVCPGGGGCLTRRREAGQAVRERADAFPQLVRLPDREVAAEAGEDARGPVERAHAHAEQRSAVGFRELGQRRGQTPRRFLERKVEEDLDAVRVRHARERAA